ncbi:hypothetical protein ACFL96_14140 [Thermoproteota archaeon]
MVTLKDLFDRPKKYWRDDAIVKDVLNNIDLFTSTKVEQKTLQAVYGISRDKASVLVLKIETELD